MNTAIPRYNIYAHIHKGLRAFMAHALVRAGRVDAHDAAEVAELTQELRALLDICASHVVHENTMLHPAIEQRAPGASRSLADDHVEHEQAIAGLRVLVDRLPGSPEAAAALYDALGSFVGHNLEHMAREETEHNAVLWRTHSDDELHAIHQRIVASIPPEESMLGLRWMVPHLNPAERAEMLGGMRQQAPQPVFEGVLSLIRPLLGGRDWRKLSLALGI